MDCYKHQVSKLPSIPQSQNHFHTLILFDEKMRAYQFSSQFLSKQHSETSGVMACFTRGSTRLVLCLKGSGVIVGKILLVPNKFERKPGKTRSYYFLCAYPGYLLTKKVCYTWKKCPLGACHIVWSTAHWI